MFRLRRALERCSLSDSRSRGKVDGLMDLRHDSEHHNFVETGDQARRGVRELDKVIDNALETGKHVIGAGRVARHAARHFPQRPC